MRGACCILLKTARCQMIYKEILGEYVVGDVDLFGMRGRKIVL